MGANVDNRCGVHRQSALWAAAARGHAAAVSFLCNRVKANPDTSDRSGKCALAVACANGHEQAAATLFNADAAINGPVGASVTPLHACCMNGRTELAQILLSVGASPVLLSEWGESVLHAAAADPSQSGGELCSLMISALTSSDALSMFQDMPRRGDGATPVAVAAAAGAAPAVLELIKSRSKTNIPTSFGQTPLFIACLGAASLSDSHSVVAVYLLTTVDSLDAPSSLFVPTAAPDCQPPRATKLRDATRIGLSSATDPTEAPLLAPPVSRRPE